MFLEIFNLLATSIYHLLYNRDISGAQGARKPKTVKLPVTVASFPQLTQ